MTTNTIPTHPSSLMQLRLEPSTPLIAVRGFRQGCGKTSLACNYAAVLSKTHTKVQVVTRFVTGVHGLAMQQHFLDTLGASERTFDINETALEGYDATIYDIDEVIEVDEIFYIAPPLIEDLLLGVSDVGGQLFRQSVSEALALKLGSVDITFVDEAEITTNASVRWLGATDWMALRDLERMHLAGSELGKLRELMRTTNLEVWKPETPT